MWVNLWCIKPHKRYLIGNKYKHGIIIQMKNKIKSNTKYDGISTRNHNQTNISSSRIYEKWATSDTKRNAKLK